MNNTDTLLDLSKDKKGFSLLEVVLVITILGVIFIITRNIFINTNKVVIDSQSCVQIVNGEVQKYINDAATGRGINSGSSLIFPDQFTISYSPLNQNIQLSYNSGSSFSIISLNDLEQCKSNEHYLALSGSELEVTIAKHLETNFNTPSFNITEGGVSSNKRTAISTIDFCRTRSTGDDCTKFFEFIIDKRKQTITPNSCLVFHETCVKRKE